MVQWIKQHGAFSLFGAVVLFTILIIYFFT